MAIEASAGESGWAEGDWERLLDALPVAVVLVAPDGIIRYANVELARLTGYELGGLTGKPIEILLPERQRDDHRRHRSRFERRPQRRPMGSGLSLTSRRADGTTFPVDVSLMPVKLGGVRYVVATVRDETERRQSEEELFRQAVHDPLTGLPNRVLLLDRLDHGLARARRVGSQDVGVIFLDLDGFKAINDRWGHRVGDDVLCVVAKRLLAEARSADTVARFGGDEFVIIGEGSEELLELARRLLATVARPVHHDVGTLHLTASIGIAWSDGTRGSADLVEAADRAMFRAKRLGGSTVHIAEA